MILLKNGKRMK